MRKARHQLHEAVGVAVLSVVLVAVLAVIEPALAAVVAIMLFGLLVVVVPIASILYDERQGRRLTH